MKGKTELLEQTGDGTDLVAQLEQLKEKLSEIEVSSGVTASASFYACLTFCVCIVYLLLIYKKILLHYLITFLTRVKSRKLKSKEIVFNWRLNNSVLTWQ